MNSQAIPMPFAKSQRIPRGLTATPAPKTELDLTWLVAMGTPARELAPTITIAAVSAESP